MARTALTSATSSSYADGVADVNFQAVDQPNGNSFTNDGKTVLLVNNGSGGNVNVTFAVSASKYTVNDAITKTPNGPVAAGDVGFYGPFPTAIYGNTVNVDYDTGTSITAAVVQLEDTPL